MTYNDETAAILPLYTSLMQEIKLRVDVVESALKHNIGLAPMPAFELCYVQLRKICEVFALSCLIAHGDIQEIKNKFYQGLYKADLILKKLGVLHPTFYPQPSRQVIVNGIVTSVEPIIGHYLTKADIIKLYGDCGNFLHRGSIKQLLKKWEPVPDFLPIIDSIKKIKLLLNHHQIQTIDPKIQIWCIMQTHSGEVQTSIFERENNPPSPPYTPA